MRFIHTADWQLGMKAAHVGEAGTRVRQERLLAAGRVAGLAYSHAVDFLLVAGDVFEDNGIDRLLVQKTADLLAGAGCPVYIIPGNHDPLVSGSVWEHPAWQLAGNVHVLKEPRPAEVPGGLLFPCPVCAKRSLQDPTAWIPAGAGDGIRIGLAHGTVEGIRQDEPDYPISRQAAQRCSLDYLALGHWHSTALYSDGGAVHTAYCGTHEATGFGERDSGNVLLVDIARPGTPPTVTSLSTGGLVWKTIEEDLRQPGDLTGLRCRIESLDHPETTLLDVRIAGLLAAADYGEVDLLDGILKSRFLYARLDTSCLLPSPADDSWISSLPAGLMRDVATRLRDLSDSRFAGTRPEGVTPEVASRALLELYAKAAEVRQ